MACERQQRENMPRRFEHRLPSLPRGRHGDVASGGDGGGAPPDERTHPQRLGTQAPPTHPAGPAVAPVATGVAPVADWTTGADAVTHNHCTPVARGEYNPFPS